MKCFIFNKECDRDKKGAEKNLAFMVSPFGFPFDDLFYKAVQPTLNELLKRTPERANQALRIGSVMCQRICENILKSEFVVADITLPNPNVYYEIGLALSLGKKIVILERSDTTNPFRFLFEDIVPKDAVMKYNTVSDLTDKSRFKKALDHAFTLNTELETVIDTNNTRKKINLFQTGKDVSSYIDKYQITYIVNGDVTVEDMFSYLQYEIGKVFTTSNGEPKWQASTHPIKSHINLLNIIYQISLSKVCIVDTTHYKNEKVSNPYMYFFLGFCHGFEREAVPITNSELSNESIPFDIQGIWQIFFKNMNDLADEFKGILRKIDYDFEKQKKEYWYKSIWVPFIQEGGLQIITCARNVESKDENRDGGRTNIDKWDYTAVAELSLLLAQHPYSNVRLSPPVSKLKVADAIHGQIIIPIINNIKEDVESYLRKNNNVVIVGSPDISDYAEILLAKLHNVQPYDKPSMDKLKKNGFVFRKKTRGFIHHRNQSSFYENGDDELVYFYGSRYTCSKSERARHWEVETYGVLTVGINPFCDNLNSRIMVISGFTGIATYGIVRLLANITRPETDPGWLNYHESMCGLGTMLSKKTVGVPNSSFDILIRVVFTYNERDNDEHLTADLRELKAVEFCNVGGNVTQEWVQCIH